MVDLISLGGNDSMRRRATEWVNGEHRREAQALKMSHDHSERSQLNYALSRINSLKQNRAGIDDRYLARVASIGVRKERIAEQIQARHNSLGGRLQALTRKGRAAQAQEFERLDGRAQQLQWRAGRNHQVHLVRHDRRVMQARYEEAQYLKIQRIDNRQSRQDYHRHNIENRPNQIHERVRELRQEQKLGMAADLKHQMNRQANQPPSQTPQNNRMRNEFKREFNQQANPLQQQFNHQARRR